MYVQPQVMVVDDNTATAGRASSGS